MLVKASCIYSYASIVYLLFKLGFNIQTVNTKNPPTWIRLGKTFLAVQFPL